MPFTPTDQADLLAIRRILKDVDDARALIGANWKPTKNGEISARDDAQTKLERASRELGNF